jgi:hypothetical protein
MVMLHRHHKQHPPRILPFRTTVVLHFCGVVSKEREKKNTRRGEFLLMLAPGDADLGLHRGGGNLIVVPAGAMDVYMPC